MKHKLLLALTISALLLAGCTKPASKPTETEVSAVAAETTTAVTSATAETTVETKITSDTEAATETTAQEQPDPIAEKIWNFLSNYESPDIPNKYFLFDFNGDDFPEVAFVGWDEDMFHKLSYPYMTIYDLSGNEPVPLGGTSQGLSPYSDDKECIGLYCNEKGEYFYHSLAHYIIKGSKGYSYNFERFIIPVDFDNCIVEFTHDPTEQRNFDNETDAEKYKERVWEELEQCTLVTELKTSYMAENKKDEEAFRTMLADLPKINYVTK